MPIADSPQPPHEPDDNADSESMASRPERRAGGGVVWRVKKDIVEVLLIHRPEHDDWSFPKGKCQSDTETYREAAVREVKEETGFTCRLGEPLGSFDYLTKRGRTKRVKYWEMTIKRGEFGPNDEVDEIAWLDVDAAHKRLSSPRDRELLAAFVQHQRSAAA